MTLAKVTQGSIVSLLHNVTNLLPRTSKLVLPNGYNPPLTLAFVIDRLSPTLCNHNFLWSLSCWVNLLKFPHCCSYELSLFHYENHSNSHQSMPQDQEAQVGDLNVSSACLLQYFWWWFQCEVFSR